jgi:hypothetical protein
MNNLKIIGVLVLLLLTVGLIIRCVTSTSSGGYAEVNAWYTISGSTISHNANVSTDWYLPGPGTEYRTLTWYCANYSGHTRSRIEITFKKVGDTWQWDSETYGTGSCS